MSVLNSTNPLIADFFPLAIKGVMKRDILLPLPIIRSSFDFYTNSLSIILESGEVEGDRFIVGELEEKGLKIFGPTNPKVGVLVKEHQLQSFVGEVESDE